MINSVVKTIIFHHSFVLLFVLFSFSFKHIAFRVAIGNPHFSVTDKMVQCRSQDAQR